MRRTAIAAVVLLLLAFYAFLTGTAGAQSAGDQAGWMGAVEELLRRGQELESNRRWADALIHYEDALRQFPTAEALERRFEVSRLHYDLGRRYADASFCDAVGRLGTTEAFNVYAEVLLKIQAHYVQTPTWKNLVERGLTDLDIAIGDPRFVERNMPQATPAAVEAFRREVRAVMANRPVVTRSEATDAVAQAARLAQYRLGLPPAALILEFACGATNTLDPYSAYLTPAQLAEVYSQIEGNFVGLGVELKAQDGALQVVRVISGSPAQKNGIRAGDRIVAVGDRQTGDYSTEQAANFLQGEVGTTVEVTVVTPGQEPRRLAVRRERIEVPSVDEVRMLDSGRGIAYLKLVCFQKTTCRDLDAALWQLHREGMRSLIVDLRGNPGGLLTTSVEVVDKFLQQGVIVTTRGRNTQEDFTYTAREEGTWRVPLVVLIDQESASAAEIFAGAVRDHRRAVVIGTRSYGKGSVQGIFPLNLSQGGVRLTTARFYSPGGRPYNRVGVEPDIQVRQVLKPATTPVGLSALPPEDAVLTAALQQAAAQAGPQR